MAELSADVRMLVDHGKERYEDSIVCDAIRHYIIRVGDIPDRAWGKMEWAGRWRKDWNIARDGRVTEATTMRDTLGDTGAALLQVAADYAGTDIQASFDFDISKQNDALAPWLGIETPGSGVSARPGGNVAPPSYFGGGNYGVTIPKGTENERS